MLIPTSYTGWSRIASSLDVEVQHGIPVRISTTDPSRKLKNVNISYIIQSLTGLSASLHNWINTTTEEQEWSLCVDQAAFTEVLRRLALSSAALFVDRFHKPIDHTAVDWDEAAYNFDYNRALERCCIPYGKLNKEDYFDDYIKTMHAETVRLVDEGLSPLVEAEQ